MVTAPRARRAQSSSSSVGAVCTASVAESRCFPESVLYPEESESGDRTLIRIGYTPGISASFQYLGGAVPDLACNRVESPFVVAISRSVRDMPPAEREIAYYSRQSAQHTAEPSHP